MEKTLLDVKVQRIFKVENNKFLKAFVDIVINDALLIKSIKVLDGKRGLFVSMPQEKAKVQKWYDSVRCVRPELHEQISEQVLAAYQAEKDFGEEL